MDSVTQIVLGAAVGEIILGRKLGNKALLLGAIGGTIPDTDVVLNFFSDDPIRHLEIHRSYSHSMFTHLVLSWPLAALSKRFDKHDITFRKWYLFWFLTLFTHALLDCCTTYGTRLFLPFTSYQVAFNNISVIDPMYTLPFLILLTCCMFFKRDRPVRRKFLWSSVIVSSFYLLMTFVLKADVHGKFKNSLSRNGIVYDELNSTPTILNSVLWAGIAYNDSMIYTSEYSYFDKRKEIEWTAYPRNLNLIEKYDSPSMKTLVWFSDGNYFTNETGKDTLTFYNIKWGKMRFDQVNPDSAVVFYFKFYKKADEVKYEQIRQEFHFKKSFEQLMNRVKGI